MLGVPFKIMPPVINEKYSGGLTPEEFAKTMAEKKVEKIITQLNGKIPQWIFGADTLVSIDGTVLGKSETREEAEITLKKLSGREHDVVTACALFCGKTKLVDCRTHVTRVSFSEISPGELEWYLETGEWQGAAGSYKIQGLAGCFINGIQGSFSAVVGLPMRLVYKMFRENGYMYGG
jgi:septum formation protein